MTFTSLSDDYCEIYRLHYVIKMLKLELTKLNHLTICLKRYFTTYSILTNLDHLQLRSELSELILFFLYRNLATNRTLRSLFIYPIYTPILSC